MNRLDIINYIIAKYSLKTYLEIGVHTGDVLDGCIAESKLGVNPDCKSYKGTKPLICITSNEYFEKLDKNAKFDLIFIDGMHEAEQVYRDINNSLLHLNDNGFIVVHDCNPPTEWHTRSYEEYKKTGGDWNGNVYLGYLKAVFKINKPYLTVNTDWGVGIIFPIRHHYFEWVKSIPATWKMFEKNKEFYLNLITIEEFKQRI